MALTDSAMPELVSADITSQLLRATPPGNEETVAALLLAVSWLQGCDRVVTLPPSIGSRVSDALRHLPRQHDPRFDAHPGTAWLLLVSLADSISAFEIARALLHEIERLLEGRVADQSGARRIADAPTHATVSLLAIVQARRGRIARQRGDVQSAVEWYRAGLMLVRHVPKGDGWATCTLGLATCAQSEGNFPETMRRCRAVLRAGDEVADHSRFGAHLTLAVCHRRVGELELALHHAWTAFDLAADQVIPQAQCLINVAEIALQLGHATAARNGFRVLLAQSHPERNRIPAHTGLLAAETVLWQRFGHPDSTSLRTRILALLADADACLMPYERIKALLAALDAAVTVHWAEQASRIDARVEHELKAAASGGTTFHEFQFRFDSSRARLASVFPVAHSDSSMSSTVAARRLGTRGQRAVDRLTRMAVPGAVDVT